LLRNQLSLFRLRSFSLVQRSSHSFTKFLATLEIPIRAQLPCTRGFKTQKNE